MPNPNNPLNFKENTLNYKIYQLVFIGHRTDISNLATELNTTKASVSSIISKTKKALSILNGTNTTTDVLVQPVSSVAPINANIGLSIEIKDKDTKDISTNEVKYCDNCMKALEKYENQKYGDSCLCNDCWRFFAFGGNK